MDFIIINKSTPESSNPVVKKLTGKDMEGLIDKIQKAEKNVMKDGKYNCQGLSKRSVIYLINVVSLKNNVRTFANTGICGSLYDEKNNISLNSKIPSQLNKYFK
ncbi:hypothetical protein PU629_08630 [Pullulanibacillus sp. KACC 23026]|uniref:hypothetical protein n=1 Tax=Pullulanibacillus sp. KACC 23026 TaxID=3028315 RepID=UPI0023B1EA33|nr:hypothetical protein [Pullulanibacillus sp. KACC 23026]WEG14406.1 hypothetical protein PU629_08630 [Pullulanibacillus sp. KACC 23026]